MLDKHQSQDDTNDYSIFDNTKNIRSHLEKSNKIN